MSAAAASMKASSRRREGVALLAYLTLLAGVAVFAVSMVTDLWGAYSTLRDSGETLARAERQFSRAPSSQSSTGPTNDASPFLSGKTVTVAGAALQERVEVAVRRAGGAVLSSQIDLQAARAAEGFVRLSESFEIQQADLQPLLYDLEAGMPYLFVESLSIQSPQAFGEAEGARMRLVMGVTGQWRESP